MYIFSAIISISALEIYLLTMAFVYQMEGYVSRITVRYWRFRSLPVNELRVLPTITPSGLSIGISLKMKRWRSLLAVKVSPVMKSMRPFIIHEAGVSLGCTRAETTIAFFFCNFIYFCEILNEFLEIS